MELLSGRRRSRSRGEASSSSESTDESSACPDEHMEHEAEAPMAQLGSGETLTILNHDFRLHGATRYHQRDALVAYAQNIHEPSGQVLMACGTGKTLVGVWMAEVAHMALSARRFLLLFPNLLLVGQTCREWRLRSRLAFHGLTVCSKLDMQQGPAQARALRPTTSAVAVADFLQRPYAAHVIFCTYHSAPTLGAAQTILRQRGEADPAFHWALFDEAHRTATRGTAMSFALHNPHVDIHQRVFATATPRHAPSSSAATSMSDATIYGRVWYSLSFRRAISEGWILPYRVLVVFFDSSAHPGGYDDVLPELVQHWARTAVRGALAGDMAGLRATTAKELAFVAAIASAMAEHGCRKCITFHNKNRRAERFESCARALFQQRGSTIEVDRVDGTVMSPALRQAKLGRFRQGTGKRIISCSRCLQEGWDAPEADMAALAEPRKSTVDIVQLVGRVTRPCAEKTCGYLVLPVSIDPHRLQDAGSAEAGVDELSVFDHAFAPVVDVLKALLAHDEALAGTLQQARQALGEQAGISEWTPPWDLPLFGHFGPGYLGREVDSVALWNLVVTKMVRLATDPWDESFGTLVQYKALHHGCTAVKRSQPEHTKLARWTAAQRAAHVDGRLAVGRVQKLNDIDFVWDSVGEQWELNFIDLVAQLAAYAFGQAPEPAAGALLNWMNYQRVHQSTLEREFPGRVRRLAMVGFVWSPSDRKWLARLEELRAYRQHYGNWNVPQSRSHRQLGRFADSCMEQMAADMAGQPCGLQGWQLHLLREAGFQP